MLWATPTTEAAAVTVAVPLLPAAAWLLSAPLEVVRVVACPPAEATSQRSAPAAADHVIVVPVCAPRVRSTMALLRVVVTAGAVRAVPGTAARVVGGPAEGSAAL